MKSRSVTVEVVMRECKLFRKMTRMPLEDFTNTSPVLSQRTGSTPSFSAVAVATLRISQILR